jgi:hypothetical protein
LASDTQDTKAIALIAYIKRLGVDIFRDEAAVFTAPDAGEEAARADD